MLKKRAIKQGLADSLTAQKSQASLASLPNLIQNLFSRY